MSSCDLCLCQRCFDNSVFNSESGTCEHCHKCTGESDTKLAQYMLTCDCFDDEFDH